MRPATLLASSLALLACSRRAAPSGTSSRAPTPAPIVASLTRHVVDNDRPWRKVLYSWTPPERAATLARDRVLLVADAMTGGSPTPFSRLLLDMRASRSIHGSIARALLTDPMLRRYRYAWPSAYPTARGFQGVSYGTSLVRIELRDDAVLLRLDPSDTQPFRLYDRSNREVPIEGFEALREHIAAVFHVRADVPVPFREYVVCNSRVVASWSVASPAACDELARERDLLDALTREELHAESPVARSWSTPLGPASSLGALWAATMATAAAHYTPTGQHLREIHRAIAACDRSVVAP